jgi:hypothetical protein
MKNIQLNCDRTFYFTEFYMCIFVSVFMYFEMHVGNKSGFLAGIMRRYSKDTTVAGDENNQKDSSSSSSSNIDNKCDDSNDDRSSIEVIDIDEVLLAEVEAVENSCCGEAALSRRYAVCMYMITYASLYLFVHICI